LLQRFPVLSTRLREIRNDIDRFNSFQRLLFFPSADDATIRPLDFRTADLVRQFGKQDIIDDDDDDDDDDDEDYNDHDDLEDEDDDEYQNDDDDEDNNDDDDEEDSDDYDKE